MGPMRAGKGIGTLFAYPSSRFLRADKAVLGEAARQKVKLAPCSKPELGSAARYAQFAGSADYGFEKNERSFRGKATPTKKPAR